MDKIKNHKGITLIELLIVLAILSIVMAIIMNTFLFSSKVYRNEDIKWQLQQEARYAMRLITSDVRAASSIAEITDSSELVIEQTIMEEEGPRVVNIKFFIDNNKLYKKVGSGSPQPLIEKYANTINFTYDSDSGVLTVTLTTKAPDSDQEYSVSTKIYSRVM